MTSAAARPTVLHVIARMNVGGPAQIVQGLLESDALSDYDLLLAYGTVDEGEQDWFDLRAPALRDDPRCIRVTELRRPIDPRADLASYRRLRELIRELRPDLVHTHTAKAGVVGRLAAFHERVPAVVHTYHGHVLHGYFGPRVSWGVGRLEARLARRTDALLAVGSRVRDELLAAGIGVPERYHVLPPGVLPPAHHDRSEARVRLGLERDSEVVVFVGRLAGVKRPDRFVAVAERIAVERPGVVFLVVGGGTDEDLAEMRGAVHRSDTRFLGWYDDVGRVYAAADIVLLTSDAEGMPVTLIEAGMCGRVCVGTDVGSVAEVVLDGETGRVVEPKTSELVDAVLELLDDRSKLAALGQSARRHTAERFSMAALVSATEKVYDSVLDRRRTA